MMYTSRVYRGSPPWLQGVLISARAAVRRRLREGRAMQAELADLRHSERLDAQGLRALQVQRLRELLLHAQQHVPFYRDRFAAAGFDARDFTAPEQLAALPVLNKSDVQAAGEHMYSEHRRGPWFSSSSSGTTGSFLKGQRDLHSIVRENAFVWRQLAWAGVELGDRRAWLRGDKIVCSSQGTAPFWRLNRADQLLMLSSYHLTEERVTGYVEALEQYDPVAIQAYPSVIVFLATVLEAQGRRYGAMARGPRKLRAIVTSSETLLASQRQLLERVFGCRVFDWYGSFERVAAIGTCEHGSLHLLSDYGYTEWLPTPQGQDLLGTGFDNFAMPLLRYRMNDRIELEPASSGACACGRAFPRVRSVLGRGQDVLVGEGDHRVFMPANVFDELPGLLAGQWQQRRPGEADLLLQFTEGGAMSEDAVLAVVRRYVGQQFKVHVRYVESIQRTASGKLPAVVHL